MCFLIFLNEGNWIFAFGIIFNKKMAEDIDALKSEEFLDSETGEKKQKVIYLKIQRRSTDAETGEPELQEKFVRRKTFKVPLKYLHSNEEPHWGHSRFRRKTEKFSLRKNQIQGELKGKNSRKQNVGPIAFVLPTLLIFPAWASIVCLLGEACMHIWSHKRNKSKKRADIEYRSPLHLISSQFCVHCKTQRWMDKISQIQDKRKLRRRITCSNVRRGTVS